MAVICQNVLDGIGMPIEWALSEYSGSNLQGKCDIRNSSYNRAVKLL